MWHIAANKKALFSNFISAMSYVKHKKKGKGLEGYCYRDFLLLFPLCGDENKAEIIKYLNHCQRPKYLGEVEVMETLNGITYGQLDDLSGIKEQKDPFAASMGILLGLTPDVVYSLPVTTVFGFANFVTAEVDRINKLFAGITIDHTSDEIAAGIEDLNFGSFGVLDWYARRMRITNQNDVRNVAWVRIYKCMKNDTEQAAYERRYNQVMMNKTKSRRV